MRLGSCSCCGKDTNVTAIAHHNRRDPVSTLLPRSMSSFRYAHLPFAPLRAASHAQASNFGKRCAASSRRAQELDGSQLHSLRHSAGVVVSVPVQYAWHSCPMLGRVRQARAGYDTAEASLMLCLSAFQAGSIMPPPMYGQIPVDLSQTRPTLYTGVSTTHAASQDGKDALHAMTK